MKIEWIKINIVCEFYVLFRVFLHTVWYRVAIHLCIDSTLSLKDHYQKTSFCMPIDFKHTFWVEIFWENMTSNMALFKNKLSMGYTTLYHTMAYIPWSRDLAERNIYSRSNQTDQVTKQWEMYEGTHHHAEQLYKESVEIRSDKCNNRCVTHEHASNNSKSYCAMTFWLLHHPACCDNQLKS